MLRHWTVLGILGVVMSSGGYCNESRVVTVNGENSEILRTKTIDFAPDELDLAGEVIDELREVFATLEFGAGLAAPQIGIGRSAFLYTPDRNPKNSIFVINPTLTPVGDEPIKRWECCFSTFLGDVWDLAHIPRYEAVDVTYLTPEGEKVEKRLTGFAAQVFQHEYDHLQGIVCTEHSDSTIREFPSKDAMMEFARGVKKEDAKRYSSSE